MTYRIVTAREFWGQFDAAIRAARPVGYHADWTRGMYDALHRVQRALGLWCQCTHHAGPNGAAREELKIDFTWYEVAPDLPEDEEDYVPIVVAIEHENSWSEPERAKDHWKVNQVATPLRIFIGYVESEEELEAAAATLRAREGRWVPVPWGQSLVIIGCCRVGWHFRAWQTAQGQDLWEELPAVRFLIAPPA